MVYIVQGFGMSRACRWGTRRLITRMCIGELYSSMQRKGRPHDITVRVVFLESSIWECVLAGG